MSLLEVLLDPIYKMVFKGTFYRLMEEVWGE